MLANYRSQFPNILANRQTFVVFTFRAHNAVNRRLHKPVYSSVEECMATLRRMVSVRPASEYRRAYIARITRHWKVFQDIHGIVALKKLQEMKRIEAEYIATRDTNFIVDIKPDMVLLPQAMMERTTEVQIQRPVFSGSGTASAGFRITPNGFRLRR
jgi:putative heme degradation protein